MNWSDRTVLAGAGSTLPASGPESQASGRAAYAPWRLSSGNNRLAVSAAPAAAITVGLFLAMMGLIRTDEIVVVEKEERILLPVTPTRPDGPIEVYEKPFELPSQVELPPTPPMSRPEVRDAGFPVTFTGGVPDTLPGKLTDFIRPVAQPIGERVPVPIRPPIPTYPRDMAARGISGSCTVHFSLSARGLPYNVVPACSHPGFENEARRAVSRTEFLPEIRDGQPMESHKLVYPLEFTLQ